MADNSNLKIILKRKFTFLAILFICILAGAVYSFTATPIYQASATLVIGPNKAPEALTGTNFMAQDPSKMEFFNTQLKLMKSHSLAADIIEELNLDESSEFNQPFSDVSLAALMAWFSSFLPSEDNGKEDITDRFLSRLIITPIPKSHVVEISFRGYSPTIVTQIITTHGEKFIQKNISLRNTNLGNSEEWMNDRLVELESKVEQSELALKDFRESTKIIEFKKDRNFITFNWQEPNYSWQKNACSRQVTFKTQAVNVQPAIPWFVICRHWNACVWTLCFKRRDRLWK